MKYSFITQRKKTYPVGLMCQLMGVSRSAYYDYVRCTDNCSADPYHEEILETVRGIANSSNHSYGSRRIGKALNCVGLSGWSLESSKSDARSGCASEVPEEVQGDH